MTSLFRYSKFFITIFVLLCSFQQLQAKSMLEGNGYRSFVSDKKALAVGDIVTLIIVESSEASTANGSRVNKDFNIEAGYAVPNSSRSGQVGMGLDRSSDQGAQRSGSLTAAITARVVDITPNGLLWIVGSQKISVDGEEQLIDVSGWVRDIDISRDNTVLSSRLSDSRISYSGYDVDGEGEKRNIFYRFFSWVGFI